MLVVRTEAGPPIGIRLSVGSGRRPRVEMSPPGVTLFLCGDVMTGRGVDQILEHPGDPRLYESWAGSALEYQWRRPRRGYGFRTP